jgi:predicted ATPase/class 3 adenylate cyclase
MRTLVFTDIVGSTEWWEKFPELMGPAVRRHDALLHEKFAQGGGRVFKTVGDAFCVVFSDPALAVRTVVEAQRAVRMEHWGELGALEIRAGVHTGVVEERDGDFFGPTLNRMARIVDAAHGGQILLSAATVGLLGDGPLGALRWRELGEFRLRSLENPERLYQVLAPDLPEDFPPPRSMAVLPHNLPWQATSFVGRERELAQIAESFEGSTRLITLLGPGGAGKTRLALEAGASLIGRFPGGVWLTELAVLGDGAQVPAAVAAAFGTREDSDLPIEQLLLKMLCRRRVLLLLDNCEHVVEAASGLVGSLLSGCPNLKVLATSRHPLGLRGEMIFPVPPLGVMNWHRRSRTGDWFRALEESEGVRLFLERARAVRPDFTLTEENAPAVAEICGRLDGLPLALELAAARLRVLSPAQIAARLQDRFRLLRESGRDRLNHQQTLQALIDWSYDLLTGEEKVLFRRLGVFFASRTLEAVEEVCADEVMESFEVLDHLQGLVEKSLLRVEGMGESGGEPNYTMLESVWEYARQKLAESGEEERLLENHTRYFLHWAATARPKFLGPEQARWLAVFDREWFNLNAVMRRLLRLERWEEAARLLIALGRPLEVRGYSREARDALVILLGAEEKIPPEMWPELLMVAGRIYWVMDNYPESQLYFERAAVAGRAAGQEELALFCEAFLGFIHWGDGRVDEAELCFAKALEEAQSCGQVRVEALCKTGLGRVAMNRGDLALARERAEAAAAAYHAVGDRWIEGLVQGGLAQVAVLQGDVERAEKALGEGLRIAVELGNEWIFPYIMQGLAEVAWERGAPADAAKFLGASARLRHQHGFQLSTMEESGVKKLMARLEETFTPPELERHLRAARDTSPLDLLRSALD